MVSRCKIVDAAINEEALIGVGPYGTIVELKWRGTIFAAKRLHDGVMLSDNRRTLKRQNTLHNFDEEVEFCANLRHPNITQFIGTYYDPNWQKTLFVMEKMQLSLSELLETSMHSPEKLLPLEKKINIMYDIIKGLNYIHKNSPPIIHQNLTSNNILIGHSLEAKISDICIAKVVKSRVDLKPLTQVPQKLIFMAPEVLSNSDNIDEKCDMFSYGVNCLLLLCHCILVPSDIETMRDTGLLTTAVYSGSTELLTACTTEFLPLVFKSLQAKPLERPSAAELCGHLAEITSSVSDMCSVNYVPQVSA